MNIRDYDDHDTDGQEKIQKSDNITLLQFKCSDRTSD